MATLKSIKNKYLAASDGTVLGVDTNTENISALSFRLATADSLSKFNLVDGFSDVYEDATGIDASGSTNETRNAANYYAGTASNSAVTGLTSGTSWTSPSNLSADPIEIIVVGGGGGAGYDQGGGGGGGGVIHHTSWTGAASTTYTYSIGGGGAGGPNMSTPGTNGGNSVWDSAGLSSTITALGGGGGGSLWNSGSRTGGSGGGGASGMHSGSGGATGSQPNSGGGTGYAFGGGSGNWNGSSGVGGGGGGASGAGANYVSSPRSGGNGGDGKLFSTFVAYGTDSSNAASTGANGGWFGGGGAGGTYNASAYGVGGTGGGGNANAGSGRVNTGGGGAGAHTASGSGGTGFIGLSYSTESFLNMTLQSNAVTAQTAPTTARIILDEESYAGATTLNTDLRAYASRDNGTTYTQVTLADQGFLLGAGGINGDTECMLHMDGTDGGTTFTDSCTEGGNTAKTWTASGNAHTSTDQYKFGTASAQFDGTGDYINTPATSDWDFGSDNFTIDFWMRPGVVDSQQRLFGNLNSGGSSAQFEFILGGSNNMSFSGSLPSGLAVTNSATLAINTWYHIAVTRSGNDWRLFVNGTAGSTASFSGTMGANTTTSIGRSGEFNAQLYTGFIDEVRITPGVAIWTANFTPPVGPYQTSRRLLSGSVDISGQPSGTAMKYKITTHNQAAAKQTRVYGASMAWA